MGKVTVRFDAAKFKGKIKVKAGKALKQAKIDKILLKAMQKVIRKGDLPGGGKNPALDAKTIQARRRLAGNNPTHKKYRAGKSNLTLTGELIGKGLKSKFIAGQFKIVIDASKSNHRKYKIQKGRSKATPSKYADIFDGQADLGRDVFDLGPKLLQKVTKIVIKELKKVIRRL